MRRCPILISYSGARPLLPLWPRLNLIVEVPKLAIIIRNGIPFLTWCTPVATRHVYLLKSCWLCSIMTRPFSSVVPNTKFWAPGSNVVPVLTTLFYDGLLIGGVNSCPSGKWIESSLLPETHIIRTLVTSSSSTILLPGRISATCLSQTSEQKMTYVDKLSTK